MATTHFHSGLAAREKKRGILYYNCVNEEGDFFKS
jgi:hypothetical protein